MDLSLFEHFAKVADKLSFTKAAEELDKSESVLSRQISRLEEELGLKLLDRNTRKIELTPAGEIIHRGILDSVAAFNKMMDEARLAQKGETGVIRIGSLVNHIIPEYTFSLIQSFKEAYKQIEVEFISTNISELNKQLNEGQLDFLFTAIDDYGKNSDIKSEFIEETRNYLLASPNNKAFTKKDRDFSLADFKDSEILVRNNHPLERQRLGAIYKKAGIEPKFRNVYDEMQYLILIRQGTCIGVTDDTHMYMNNSTVTFAEIPEFGTLRMGLCYIPYQIPNSGKVFLDYIRKATKE